MKPIMSALLFTPALALAEANPEVLWTASGLDQPESVVAHGGGDLFISNVAGESDERNGKGYIARVTKDGEMLEQRWASGLNAPKGMAVVGNRLFVADLERLVIIDADSAEVLEELTPGAQMLNDVAADDQGQVYVSDMAGNAIYRYADGKFEVWLETSDLGHPNGLEITGDEMLVASWGFPLSDDMSTDNLGTLYQVDMTSGQMTPVPGTNELGNLDGVLRHGDEIWVSDFMSGDLYRTGPGEEPESVGQYGRGLADISREGDVLFLPLMMDNEVRALRLP